MDRVVSWWWLSDILDLAGKEFAIWKSKNLLYVLTGCELLEAAIESWLEWDP